jgi:hypothetical protein
VETNNRWEMEDTREEFDHRTQQMAMDDNSVSAGEKKAWKILVIPVGKHGVSCDTHSSCACCPWLAKRGISVVHQAIDDCIGGCVRLGSSF